MVRSVWDRTGCLKTFWCLSEARLHREFGKWSKICLTLIPAGDSWNDDYAPSGELFTLSGRVDPAFVRCNTIIHRTYIFSFLTVKMWLQLESFAMEISVVASTVEPSNLQVIGETKYVPLLTVVVSCFRFRPIAEFPVPSHSSASCKTVSPVDRWPRFASRRRLRRTDDSHRERVLCAPFLWFFCAYGSTFLLHEQKFT